MEQNVKVFLVHTTCTVEFFGYRFHLANLIVDIGSVFHRSIRIFFSNLGNGTRKAFYRYCLQEVDLVFFLLHIFAHVSI